MIEVICPRCQFDNPSGMKFCGNCGAQLPEQSSAEGERRRVTILFADVTGFTAMSEQLDPEEVYHLMNRCFERLGDVIARHGGTVDKFIGDCVMALFGAPIAHENDPERAVRAALEMQDELVAFGRAQALPAPIAQSAGAVPPALQMRIGINSGVVVAGAVGSDQQRQYTVMGDAVNVANRVQSAAEPGDVLVTESVYRQTNRLFQFVAWEPIWVKGKDQPIAVYEVVGLKDEVVPIDKGRHRATFVGRGKELATLLEALERACTGQGQVVHLVGESGIGKSRLLEEFIESMGDRTSILLHRACHLGEQHSAYQTWRGIMSQLCGVEGNESEEERRSKIVQTLTAIDPALTEWTPYLADIFGLPRIEGVDALTAKRVTQQVVRQVMMATAQKSGLVLVVDDLHWADPLSLELFTLLTKDVASSNILFIGAHHPEFVASGSPGGNITTLYLQPLSADESARLAASLLGVEEVPSFLKALILERAGGNPFFIEELVRTLVETGAMARVDGEWVLKGNPEELQLPEAVEAALTSRIDRLKPEAKRLLQYAAVIGNTFPVSVLQKVVGLNDGVVSTLAQLESAEFVKEVSPPPQWEFGFQQVLIREIAYQMLLLQRRRQYHESVARAIEELYEGRLEEQYESLAYHYARSANLEKAIEYLIKAGQKAMRLFATVEARTCFTDALGLCRQLPPAERERYTGEELCCQEVLGDMLVLTGDYEEALTQYQAMLQSWSTGVVSESDCGCSLRVKTTILKRKIGNLHARKADFAEATRWLQEALAEVENDHTEEGRREVAKIWSELAVVSLRRGHYAEAAEQAARGLLLAEALNSRKEIGDCCLVCGLAEHSRGSDEIAESYLRRSLQIREELGDLVGIASALNNLGSLLSNRGRYQEADEFYQRSFDLRAKMAHSEGMSAALVNRGNVAFNLGNYQDAEGHYQQALALAEKIGSAYIATSARLNLGRALLEQVKIEEALKTLSITVADAERLGFEDLLSLARSVLAQVYLAKGARDEAETEVQKALSLAESIGSKFHQAFALRVLGLVLAAQEQREIATKYLRKSVQLFEEIHAIREAAQSREALESM